jgi:hypothetical protein
MKKYYFEYLAACDSAVMDYLIVVEGTSLGDAYRNIGAGMLLYGENFSSDQEALERIKSGNRCSINFGFLIPEEFQDRSTAQLQQQLKESVPFVAEAFKNSSEKALNPNTSRRSPKILRKAFRSYWWDLFFQKFTFRLGFTC